MAWGRTELILLAVLCCSILSSGAPVRADEDIWTELSSEQQDLQLVEASTPNCHQDEHNLAPDLTFVLNTDGTCRSSAGNHPSVASIAYKASCSTNGSSSLSFLAVAQTPDCLTGVKGSVFTPVTASAGECFVPFPAGVDGAQITCMQNGAATLRVWLTAAPAPPPLNSTDVTIQMSDGAPLFTVTVFSPGLPFPDTGSTKAAALYVSTPYNINSAFGTGMKYLVSTIESIVYPLTGIHFDTVLVLQQARGLYASGPPTTGFAFDTGSYGKSDAGDTARWIEQQAWHNGVIMTQGISAMGMFALMAADPAYPVPTSAAWYSITTNNIREAFYRQGAMVIGIMGSILMPDYLPPDQTNRAVLSQHDSDGPDPFWDNMLFDQFDTINYPTLVRTGWFDMFLKGGLRTGLALNKKARCGVLRVLGCTTTLIVDALGHAGLAGLPKFEGAYPVNGTAQDALVAYEQILSAVLFFVFQKASNPVFTDGLLLFYDALMHLIPDNLVYVYGKDYITAFKEFPRVSQQPLYLAQHSVLSETAPRGASSKASRRSTACADSTLPDGTAWVDSGGYTCAGYVSNQWCAQYGDGSANGGLTANQACCGCGGGAPSSQSYIYDPQNPAPTYGGGLFSSAPTYGSVDQTPLGARDDVLQFDFPVKRDLALCGAVSATITVTSSAVDTDFIVRLVDQHPNNGARYLITEGVIRMRWREQKVTPTMMEPGTAYEVEIDMASACWIVKAGHSVGVDVTSSSEFMYLPNPNTGGNLQPDGIWPSGGEYYDGPNVTATNSIVFGESRVTLPVVREADLPVMGPLIIPSSLSPPSSAEELVEMGKGLQEQVRLRSELRRD